MRLIDGVICVEELDGENCREGEGDCWWEALRGCNGDVGVDVWVERER
jgi:hypothetical protein